MINLRKQLNIILKSLHPRIYYQLAPETAVFPYIVYNLPNSFSNESQDIFNLDIDIWDNKADTSEIEGLNSLVWKELNKYQYIDENIQFSSHRMNRLNVEDDDKRIKRRKLIFQLRFYNREG